MSFTKEQLNNIWKIFNNIRKVKTPSTTSFNRQRLNNLQFGEERRNHIVFETNMQYAPMKAHRFNNVRLLANQITLSYYGEEKYGTFIMGIYNDFVEARERLGYKGGLRGMNMKGVVCAILYLIVLYENKATLNKEKLIRVANKIKTESKVKVTDRMITKYVNQITQTLREFRNSSSNNSSNENETTYRSIELNIRRIAFELLYTRKETMHMIKLLRKVPIPLLENYKNDTIAKCIVYIYQIQNANKNNKKKIMLTDYIKQTALHQIASSLNINIPNKPKVVKPKVVKPKVVKPKVVKPKVVEKNNKRSKNMISPTMIASLKRMSRNMNISISLKD